MLKKEELYKTPEYWIDSIQNELYYSLKCYMTEKGLNQSELANELGYSKGYISQILNGNFNHSLTKMAKLLLAINRVPSFEFSKLDDFISLKTSDSNMKILEKFEYNTSSNKVESRNDKKVFKPLTLHPNKISA